MVAINAFWMQHCQRRLLLAVLMVLGVVGVIIAVVWLLACIFFAPDGARPMHIVVGFDQLLNAATGGSEDETISSRAGRLQAEDVKWACVLCKLLDSLERDHCKNSIGT